ncbi:MAG: hypothetical protein AAFM91_09105 [Pseudomonadota bacterium]
MERPIRIGALFGIGFAITVSITIFVLEYVVFSAIEQLYPETEYGKPDVVSSDAAVRDGFIVVLATVANSGQEDISFDAQGVLYGDDGRLLDTCDTDRIFDLEPAAEVSFKAVCSAPVDTDYSLADIDRATVQFLN